MKEVGIFVASSIVDFKEERAELLEYFDMLNKAHKWSDVQLVWNMPEKDMPDDMRTDGSQAGLDEEIRKCDYCVFIIGAKFGQYTRNEFEVAWDSFQKSGKPKILPYFLPQLGKVQTQAVATFEERLKEMGHYYKVCKSIADIKVRIDFQLALDGVFYPKSEAPVETTPAPQNSAAEPVETPAPQNSAVESVTPPPQDSAITLEDMLEREQTYLGNLVYYLSRVADGDADACEGAAVNDYNLGLVKAMRGKLSVAKLYFEQSLLLFNMISEEDAQDCRNRLAELKKLEDSDAPDNSDEEDVAQVAHLSSIAAGSGIANMISGLFDVFLGDD